MWLYAPSAPWNATRWAFPSERSAALRSRSASSCALTDIAMTSRKISVARNASRPSSRAWASTLREERGLACRVPEERDALLLETPDLRDELQAERERLEELAIRLVDAPPEVVERVHEVTRDVTGS